MSYLFLHPTQWILRTAGSPPPQSSVPTAPEPLATATAATAAAAAAAPEELAAARALVAELTIRGRDACEAGWWYGRERSKERLGHPENPQIGSNR